MNRYQLTFNDDACKGCGLCTSVCPTKILSLNPKRINQAGYSLVDVSNIDKCIGCTFCATICPDSVIKVEQIDG
ncbi:MAG: 4Fe-4S dicluster domain-containing protein [Bacteroidia bacterium]|nr:4Fe-4S dicluster domain-containing protein [Bacteroidia bacterium]